MTDLVTKLKAMLERRATRRQEPLTDELTPLMLQALAGIPLPPDDKATLLSHGLITSAGKPSIQGKDAIMQTVAYAEFADHIVDVLQVVRYKRSDLSWEPLHKKLMTPLKKAAKNKANWPALKAILGAVLPIKGLPKPNAKIDEWFTVFDEWLDNLTPKSVIRNQKGFKQNGNSNDDQTKPPSDPGQDDQGMDQEGGRGLTPKRSVGKRGKRGKRVQPEQPGSDGVGAGGERGGDELPHAPGSPDGPGTKPVEQDVPTVPGDSSGPVVLQRPTLPPLIDRPPVGDPARNYEVEGPVAPSGPKAKVDANFRAIELLLQLEEEKRNATTEEKHILAAFTSWGSLPQLFDEDKNDTYEREFASIQRNRSYWSKDHVGQALAELENSPAGKWRKQWGEAYDYVKKNMSKEEYASTKKTTINAHYTSPEVMAGMWKIVRRLGFKGGRALEPSCGAGHFAGTQPQDLADRTKWTFVELDEFTSRLASKLYPEARVNAEDPGADRNIYGQGFQNSKIPVGSQDLVITNVPFDKTGPYQSEKEFGIQFNLHNYFFARALTKTKPGGLVCMISSAHTMDSSPLQRQKITELGGDFIGAFRLPNNAFLKNAGTQVVTDIVILRKRKGGKSAPYAKDWNADSKVVGSHPIDWKVVTERSRGNIKIDLYATFEDWEEGMAFEDPEAQAALMAWMEGKPEGGAKVKKLKDCITRLWRKKDTGNYYNQVFEVTVLAPIRVNGYFADNPRNIAGINSRAGGMYGKDQYTVEADPNRSVDQALDEFIQSLPADIMDDDPAASDQLSGVEAARDKRENGYFQRADGSVYQVQDGIEVNTDFSKHPKKVSRFSAYCRLRDAAVALVNAETSPATTDAQLDVLRGKLNDAYDDYVSKYGNPSARRNGLETTSEVEGENGKTHPRKGWENNDEIDISDDIEFSLVQALETEETDSKKNAKGELVQVTTYKKADIFSRRILTRIVEPGKAKDIEDAVKIAMSFRGSMDIEYMAHLLDASPEEVKRKLLEKKYGFVDPLMGSMVSADEYLSGSVAIKLKQAKVAAESDPTFAANVEALIAALPPRADIGLISVQIGSRWVPVEVYEAFAKEILGARLTVTYAANYYNISSSGYGGTAEYGTERVSAKDIFDHTLNLKSVQVNTKDSNGNSVPDAKQTELAKAAQEKQQEAFKSFCKLTATTIHWQGEQKSVPEVIEDVFNEVVNGVVPPTYKGDWVTLPGQAIDADGEPVIHLKEHRKAVLARLLTQGCGMMAHGVGSGKTYAQIALAQELRRLGKAKKPMIVVQNSTIRQFAASYKKAYPNAKILVADDKNFSAKKRKKFLARIATGDWDCVILTQSNFEMIPSSEEMVKEYFREELEMLEDIVREAKRNKSNKNLVKEIEKAKNALEEKRAKMLDDLKSHQDDTLTWEQLGIDALIIDEAHSLKNLPVVTRMSSRGEKLKNLPTGSGSLRSVSAILKTKTVQKRNSGKGVYFATGTPVTNTIAEVYTMIRFISPQTLKDNGITNFDEFVSMFAVSETSYAASWKNKPEKVISLTKFVNGVPLQNMVRSVFDVSIDNEAMGLRVPKLKSGQQEVLEATPTMQKFNQWISELGAKWPPKKDEMDKNGWMTAIPIMTMNAGAVAALDCRLINPNAPDEPGSKVNRAIAKAMEIYHKGGDLKTTQIFFTDYFNPVSISYLKQWHRDPFAEYGDFEPYDDEEDDEGEEGADPSGGKKKKKAKKRKADPNAFNLFDDIKRKLIAHGVPAKEIFAVTNDVKIGKLTEVFDEVNKGNIRFLIGSTDKLGVGVNVQERLAAIHHLMPPRRMIPAMMEQRKGRIVRQNNLHKDWADQAFIDVVEKAAKLTFEGKKLKDRFKAANTWLTKNDDGKIRHDADKAASKFEVLSIEYAVKGTMDSNYYSIMARKQGFIEQIMNGKADWEFQDAADGVVADMVMMAASTLGDPDFLREVELDRDIKQLVIRKDGWESQRASRLRGLARDESLVGNTRNTLSDLEAAFAYQKVFKGDKKPVWTLNGVDYDTSKSGIKITELLEAYLEEESKALARKYGATNRESTIMVNGLPIKVYVDHRLSDEEDVPGMICLPVNERVSNKTRVSFKGARSFLMTVQYVCDVDSIYAREKAQMEQLEKGIADVKNALEKEPTFPQEKKLEALKKEQMEVRDRLSKKKEKEGQVRNNESLVPVPGTKGGREKIKRLASLAGSVRTD